MELQASRSGRASAIGEPILLLDQDRGGGITPHPPRWRVAARRAPRRVRPYALQAAIAACHASARTPEETDWTRIVALYDACQLLPSRRGAQSGGGAGMGSVGSRSSRDT